MNQRRTIGWLHSVFADAQRTGMEGRILRFHASRFIFTTPIIHLDYRPRYFRFGQRFVMLLQSRPGSMSSAGIQAMRKNLIFAIRARHTKTPSLAVSR